MPSLTRHPGNSPSADPMEQARYLLELLAELGPETRWNAITERTNLEEHQVQNALRYLNAQGYVAAIVGKDLKMRYSATLLGRSVLDFARLAAEGAKP